jgi:hypothetical protein
MDKFQMENYTDVDVHSTKTDSSDASLESDVEYNSSENSEDEDGNYVVLSANQSSNDEDVAHNDDDEDVFEADCNTPFSDVRERGVTFKYTQNVTRISFLIYIYIYMFFYY